ncbi:MAG: TlpA disulfide reductase family protein [Treponemataceae bacterium]
MKNFYRTLLVLVLCVFCAGFVFAAGKTETAKSNDSFELTDAEKEEGWRYFMPLGIKIKRPAFWDKYDDCLWVDDLGEAYDTPEAEIFKAYVYSYANDKALAIDEEIYLRYQKQELSVEEAIKLENEKVVPLLKPIYGLFALRTKAIAGKDLKSITGFPIVKVLKETKEYTQVLGLAEFSPKDLNEKEQAIYKEMLSEVMPASKTISCTKPKLPEDILLAITNLKFDTIDLDGKQVTSKILKDYDVTMINIWATWCGPCRAELPEIAKLYDTFKDKNCNIIGITGDVTPTEQDSLETAKKLTSDAGCKYKILQRNDSLKALFKGVPAWPTTIFVDKNGKILAASHKEIIIGSRSLEEFTEAFEEALKKAKK